MTLTERCRLLGLPRVTILIDRTGYSREELKHMNKVNPRLLDILIKGVLWDYMFEFKQKNKVE